MERQRLAYLFVIGVGLSLGLAIAGLPGRHADPPIHEAPIQAVRTETTASTPGTTVVVATTVAAEPTTTTTDTPPETAGGVPWSPPPSYAASPRPASHPSVGSSPPTTAVAPYRSTRTTTPSVPPTTKAPAGPTTTGH